MNDIACGSTAHKPKPTQVMTALKSVPTTLTHNQTIGVAEIPDQEIAQGSFRSKLQKWRFRLEERRAGLAPAR